MSKQLKSLSLVALFAAMFMFQSPTPASAGWGWLCWWCGPPSAEELIDERSNLRNLSGENRNELKWTIEKYRDNGAPESDVELFLDALNREYRSGSLFKKIYHELVISSAYAGRRGGLGGAANGLKQLISDILGLLKKNKDKVKNPNAADKTAADVQARAAKTLASSQASSAFKSVGNLAGKTPRQVKELLENRGFKFNGVSEGGYAKFYKASPEGRVQIIIKPNGQVTRSVRNSGKRWDSQGREISSHDAGEIVEGSFRGL